MSVPLTKLRGCQESGSLEYVIQQDTPPPMEEQEWGLAPVLKGPGGVSLSSAEWGWGAV